MTSCLLPNSKLLHNFWLIWAVFIPKVLFTEISNRRTWLSEWGKMTTPTLECSLSTWTLIAYDFSNTDEKGNLIPHPTYPQNAESGTTYFMAPGIFVGNIDNFDNASVQAFLPGWNTTWKLSQQSDIYSAGIMFFEWIFGKRCTIMRYSNISWKKNSFFGWICDWATIRMHTIMQLIRACWTYTVLISMRCVRLARATIHYHRIWTVLELLAG